MTNTIEMSKQAFLYHSSPLLLDVIMPQQATGICNEKDKKNAVYATPYRNCAIAFGLNILPVNEKVAWRLNFPNKDYNMPIIKIEEGLFDSNGIGYLYIIPPDSFTKIDDWQWISTEAIIPIKHEIIKAESYISWIQYERKNSNLK